MDRRGFLSSWIGDVTAVAIIVFALFCAAILFGYLSSTAGQGMRLTGQMQDQSARAALHAIMHAPIPIDLADKARTQDANLANELQKRYITWKDMNVMQSIINLAMAYDPDAQGYLDTDTQSYLLRPIITKSAEIPGKATLSIEYPPVDDEGAIEIAIGSKGKIDTLVEAEREDVARNKIPQKPAKATTYLAMPTGEKAKITLEWVRE